MPFSLFLAWLLASSVGAVGGDDPPPSAKEEASLARRFEAIRTAHENRANLTERVRSVANQLDPKARIAMIAEDENQSREDRVQRLAELQTLIHEKADDPSVFDGLLLLTGPMNSFPDALSVAVARRYMGSDPRAGLLCDRSGCGLTLASRGRAA